MGLAQYEDGSYSADRIGFSQFEGDSYSYVMAEIESGKLRHAAEVICYDKDGKLQILKNVSGHTKS